jgi:hypothetical protein
VRVALGQLLPRHVVQEDVEQAAPTDLELRHVDDGGELHPVPPHEGHLGALVEAVGLAGLEEASQPLAVELTVARGNDRVVHVEPDRLEARAAEDPLGGRVPGRDLTPLVERHESLAGALEHRTVDRRLGARAPQGDRVRERDGRLSRQIGELLELGLGQLLGAARAQGHDSHGLIALHQRHVHLACENQLAAQARHAQSALAEQGRDHAPLHHRASGHALAGKQLVGQRVGVEPVRPQQRHGRVLLAVERVQRPNLGLHEVGELGEHDLGQRLEPRLTGQLLAEAMQPVHPLLLLGQAVERPLERELLGLELRVLSLEALTRASDRIHHVVERAREVTHLRGAALVHTRLQIAEGEPARCLCHPPHRAHDAP